MARKGTTKYESQKQEKDIARKLGGKTVVASGALDGAKGDVKLPHWLVEAKTTQKTEYVLKQTTIKTIIQQANGDGMRNPLFVLDMKGKRYVMFRTNDSEMPNSNDLYRLLNTNEIEVFGLGRTRTLTQQMLKTLDRPMVAKLYSIGYSIYTCHTWALVCWDTFQQLIDDGIIKM